MCVRHEMSLAPVPFQKIKSGQKTLELRLNDEKRRGIAVGDEILFTNTQTGERMTARVLALYPFASFQELYRALPLDRCGYAQEEIYRADPADMNAYYSEEKQKKYGALGIEIEYTGA